PGRRSVGRRSRAPAPRWPWASFFRPYRALRGTGGILPPDFSKNVQSPKSVLADQGVVLVIAT
ncbi:MAG TPA: hypothetical protein VMW38_25745, partial [Terriglobia bacterium]|nr:hypothetical protein [Terriglobia bacterium]